MSASRSRSAGDTRSPDGDTHARRHREGSVLCAVELERLFERGEQALGDQVGAGGERQVLGDDDELVAAQAPECVGGPHDGIQSRGDRLQQFVAGAVSEGVVDALEVVEIDEQRGDRRVIAP